MGGDTDGAPRPDEDEEEEDEEYVPHDSDSDGHLDDEFENLDGEAGDPEAAGGKASSGKGSKKRKGGGTTLPAHPLKRNRVGGIALSDDEEEESEPKQPEAAPAQGEQEADGEDDVAPAAEPKKEKSKIDDIFEEMKRESTKKPEKPKSTNINSFIAGLVSKAPASKKSGSGSVLDLFPTTVKKQETVVVQQQLDFAGEKVTVQKEVEVGSEEHKKMANKGPKKTNLDNLIERLQGKGKKMNTIDKTEHDWGNHVKKEGLEDELSTYKKNGYMEKQKFLANADEKLESQLKEQRQQERQARARAQNT